MLRARVSRSCLPLLLVAVLLRSLVADGYMPGADGTVTLCTPKGLVAVALPGEGKGGTGLDTGSAAECPWDSVFFTTVLSPAGPALPARRPSVALPAFHAGARATRPALALPPARAPPQSLS